MIDARWGSAGGSAEGHATRRSRRCPARTGGLLVVVSSVSVCAGDEQPTSRATGSWQVGSDPVVLIGASPVTPEAALHGVLGAIRLADGGTVVADGGLGSSRLSRFGPDGSYERSMGGEGDGPGEFRWITSIASSDDDSVFVFDGQSQRLTVFGPDGRLSRTVNVQDEVRTDGTRFRTLLPVEGELWMARELGSPVWAGTPTVRYDTIAAGVVDWTLRTFRPLTSLPGPMSTTVEIGGRRLLGSPAFAPYPSVATWGRCIFTTTGATQSISVHTVDGDLVRTLNGPGDLRGVTPDHLDALLADRLRLAQPDDESMIRASHREAARMTHLPYYHQMTVDAWGHLWLQEYAPPRGPGPRWYVMSQAGESLGEVEWPKPIDVFAIDEAGVLGRTRGELDEERIELLAWEDVPSRRAAPLDQCVRPG